MGDEDVAVSPGHLLTVPARVEHRFHSVEQDLLLLVFFTPAEGSAEGEAEPPSDRRPPSAPAD
jgi:mannose-6-phosphate isomerase-like protein (cupin superfamily)